MRPQKLVLIIAGAVAALVALGLAAGGGALVYAHVAERDDAGFYTSPTGRFETPTYALTSEHIDLATDVRRGEWGPLEDFGTLRIEATGALGTDVFLGIGRSADVDRYLASSSHDELVDATFDPFGADYRRTDGEVAPAAPAAQTFWVASSAGSGAQQLRWDVRRGDWTVVVMNADSSRGVAVDATVGIRTGLLLPIGLALLGVALLVGALGVAALLAATLRRSPAPVEGAVAPPRATGTYPVRLDGRIDEDLSRWLWLVKWFLAIPHLLVLALLGAAMLVLTLVAGVCILFTGRYPRGIFDFNVGVMRWSWRVSFYAFTLATDRYPPFTLESVPDYPADLVVEHPDQLSPPLVLVKPWLLALPHLLIISVFGGGFTWWNGSVGGDEGAFQLVAMGGLIGFLAFVAGVSLAFTGRYPRSVYDFVMGMQRWTYRVVAYVALMRDEYPPFRLDAGGRDPGTVLPIPPPPAPPTQGTSDRPGELVTSS